MKHLLPFPKPDEVSLASNSPKRAYAPFRSDLQDHWTQQLLEETEVHVLSAIQWECTARWKMEPRRMPFDTLHYILRGSGKARINEREYPLTAGDCACFRREILHSALTTPSAPFRLISLRYTAQAFGALSLPEIIGFPEVFPLQGDSRIRRLFEDACRDFAIRPAGLALGLDAIGARIILHLIREHGDRLDLSSSRVRLKELRRLVPAIEAMKQNLANPLSIPTLARLIGLSAPQFRRVFLKAMGGSPVQYLRRLRMERACLLLRQTDQTIESIAAHVGYGQPPFFATTFKQLIGIAPGQYRRSHEL